MKRNNCSIALSTPWALNPATLMASANPDVILELAPHHCQAQKLLARHLFTV